jgi:DNA-binding LytR/AlgR family response regulator
MNSSSFLQVHRSYVINKNSIDAFNTKEISINENIIPISKTFTKEIIEAIS